MSVWFENGFREAQGVDFRPGLLFPPSALKNLRFREEILRWILAILRHLNQFCPARRARGNGSAQTRLLQGFEIWTGPWRTIFRRSEAIPRSERTNFLNPTNQHKIYIKPYSHIVTHIMKTTLDLPDDLLIAAKALAALRKTTLKAMVEHALRREIAPQENLAPDSPYESGPFGILSLKKRTETLSAEQVQHLIDHQYDEEDARIISISTGNA